MTRALPMPAHQLGAFTVDQAADLGWTSSALRHAVRMGRADRLWKGAYAAPVTGDASGRDRRLAQIAIAGALTNDGVLLSHLGAASVHGWPWWAPDPHPCGTLVDGGVTAAPGLHVHRCEVAPIDRWRAGVLPVTSPARTVVDVAREFGEEVGVVVGDAALHRRAVERGDLVSATRDATGRRGVARARFVVPFLDRDTESVLESRSRYRMHVAGIPAPLTQVDIATLDGRWIARVDFYWPEFGVVGEADGELKYATRTDLIREKRREDALRETRLVTTRWAWRDLDPFEPTARRLWAAFERGGQVVRRRRWVATTRECGSWRRDPG